ncbi:MAG: hypothetical protein M3R14_03120 [Acidobacteriota bacterium]|nr:hypothetical protein [Acidobacteriota bacterium]
MNYTEIVSDVLQKQPALVTTGLGFILLFFVLAVISIFDTTQILGINRWIKPMKFASSIGIFLLTVAVFLSFVRGYESSKLIVAWTMILTMIGEMIVIVLQAARGTTSHFNTATGLDGALFGLMGTLIALNTLAAIYLLFLYFVAEINLPAPIVWGVRLGMILFLMASVEGGVMLSQSSHSVGAADGGAGLPFVNWSSEAGDLRVAHFIGLHAMQILPVAALAFVWLQDYFRQLNPTILTFVLALVYFAAFNFLFLQAMRGQPLWRIESAQTNARQEFYK